VEEAAKVVVVAATEMRQKVAEASQQLMKPGCWDMEAVVAALAVEGLESSAMLPAAERSWGLEWNLAVEENEDHALWLPGDSEAQTIVVRATGRIALEEMLHLQVAVAAFAQARAELERFESAPGEALNA